MKPVIKHVPQVANGNPNDSLPTALMDDPTAIMDDLTAVMGQPASTPITNPSIGLTVVKPKVS